MCKSIFISIILTCFFSCKAYPEVVINGTRIVFHAQDKESVIQLMNKGKNPIWYKCGWMMATRKPGPVKSMSHLLLTLLSFASIQREVRRYG